MKTKLSIFLLFACLNIFGQVPDNATFSLFDVLDAVYGSHASGNLVSAFEDSEAGKFDLDYGNKAMSPRTMLGFRNYGAGCFTPYIPHALPVTNNVSGTQVTVNWEVSIGSDGYTWEMAVVPDFSWIHSGGGTSSGTQTSQLWTGLTSGTTYYFRMKADNSCGSSAYSNIITFITPG